MELWTVDEAAHYLKYHAETVRRLARLGRIPVLRVGGRWRFRPERLAEWVDAGCPDPSEQPSLFSEATPGR